MPAHAAVACLIVPLAGCGGGLSRNELVSQGDAIAACAGDTAKLQRVGADAEAAQERYRKLSDKIGFKECGEGT
jgi:hypothetical protein